MSKSTGFSKRVETWNVRESAKSTDRVTVVKIAVRDKDGRFHGSTNFKQK